MINEIIVSDRSSPDFLRTAHAVGDYIKALPLTVEQNDTLISLIAENMNESDKGAFRRGIDIGVAIGKHKKEQNIVEVKSL